MPAVRNDEADKRLLTTTNALAAGDNERRVRGSHELNPPRQNQPKRWPKP
jgi:hypothetical protein